MDRTRIIRKQTREIVDLFGPTIEFLSPREDGASPWCVLLGTIPAGGSVPLHSHADIESFYVLSGSIEVFCPEESGSKWVEAGPEDLVHVPAAQSTRSATSQQLR